MTLVMGRRHAGLLPAEMVPANTACDRHHKTEKLERSQCAPWRDCCEHIDFVEFPVNMGTSWHGNDFRISGNLWGYPWIPLEKDE